MTKEATEDLIKKLKTDRIFLQLLADLLSFPGSEFLNSNKLESEISGLQTSITDNEIQNKLFKIQDVFNKSSQQELMVEYARLFVGPYHVISPPYGSYYLESGRLMGDSTIEVQKIYQSAGLVINESFKDLPDHVIAELEFLVFLIHNEIIFIENAEINNYKIISDLKKEFYNIYFYSWIKMFSSVIFENTNNEFYKLVSDYLNNIVNRFYLEINNDELKN